MKLTNLTNEQEIQVYKSLKKEENNTLIPPGYTEISLSTCGKLGAPSLFHIRNFKVRDILTLSLTNDIDLPVRLIEILNDMILEDVDVGLWHEKEVEELMVYIFLIFYKDALRDIDFPYTDEDIEFLKNTKTGKTDIQNLKDKKWIPKTDIILSRDVSTYDLPENFKPVIRIFNKNKDFYLDFGYNKYRDQILVRKWLDSFFKEDENKYKVIENQINFNNSINSQLLTNPNLINNLIDIDPELEDEYKNYINRRLQVTTEIVKLISIVNYNGQDVSNLSISEKYALMANDARIDYNMIAKLNKKQEKIHFGIKPYVSMMNPITGKPCERRFSFRIPAILQAIQLSGDDDEDDDNYV